MAYSSVYLVVDQLPQQGTINPELSSKWIGAFKDTYQDCPVQVVTAEDWASIVNNNQGNIAPDILVCPLMLQLPDTLPFSGQSVYEKCGHLDMIREQVRTQWGYEFGNGHQWLPIVLTAKGPLYGEVIGCSPVMTNATQQTIPSYQQPIHLSDQWRQPVYRLGYSLLTDLGATPGVYLLQFALENDVLLFDRLWPFPYYPALASVGVQSPNLFECHWRCLTEQPILDLTIVPQS
ncbi:MAG: hypothetical protein F6K09_17100 [Merismopedia sp. SIO2A8]|nr:hypothetical protein [Symploca sp. SIO2B6]NET50377.1 hypothetical protein [Merismopedia sp. SIO2A8]